MAARSAVISVLTLVKNRELHLRRLVEGLERSTLVPAELVIVDMSDRAIDPFACACPVDIVRLETAGLPLARARNLAAARARGEHLLFLDVDCIPSATLLTRMSEVLANRDALVCAEVRYLGGDAIRDGWTEYELFGCGRPHPVRDFPADGLRREDNAGLFWSLAFGIRRSTFDRLGGFDETFSGYGAEDTDFGFTARQAGVELLFLGGCPAFHQHHGVVDPPLHHFADIVRNATTFRHKWGRWPMEGWLAAFRDVGLVSWTEHELFILREPTASEIAGAAQPPHVMF